VSRSPTVTRMTPGREHPQNHAPDDGFLIAAQRLGAVGASMALASSVAGKSPKSVPLHLGAACARPERGECDEKCGGVRRAPLSAAVARDWRVVRVLQEHLASFVAAANDDGDGLPAFVQKELRSYLSCGVLAHGFARFKCGDCPFERWVPLSCKGRGFCPSCGGKRMTGLAAELLDGVIPFVPACAPVRLEHATSAALPACVRP
jgi:hypothetical protein